MILKRVVGSLAFVAVISMVSAFVYKKENATLQPAARLVRNGFAVVELFTSEGCSSCPPADQLIGTFVEKYGNQPVYLLTYHVDYWDDLGWKDQFSRSQYSLRQQQYSRILRSQIYTPQLIVNGKMQMTGSDQNAAEHAIETALADSENGSLGLSVKVSGKKADVAFNVTGSNAQQELLISLIEKKAYSYVKRGENKGLRLIHWQIVHQQKQVPLSNSSQVLNFKLPENFDTNNWEVIGMVQHTETGAITGAAKLLFK